MLIEPNYRLPPTGIKYIFSFQDMTLMYRRSVCAAARKLDCDLVLEDKARPQHRWKEQPGKAGKK